MLLWPPHGPCNVAKGSVEPRAQLKPPVTSAAESVLAAATVAEVVRGLGAGLCDTPLKAPPLSLFTLGKPFLSLPMHMHAHTLPADSHASVQIRWCLALSLIAVCLFGGLPCTYLYGCKEEGVARVVLPDRGSSCTGVEELKYYSTLRCFRHSP